MVNYNKVLERYQFGIRDLGEGNIEPYPDGKILPNWTEGSTAEDNIHTISNDGFLFFTGCANARRVTLYDRTTFVFMLNGIYCALVAASNQLAIGASSFDTNSWCGYVRKGDRFSFRANNAAQDTADIPGCWAHVNIFGFVDS